MDFLKDILSGLVDEASPETLEQLLHKLQACLESSSDTDPEQNQPSTSAAANSEKLPELQLTSPPDAPDVSYTESGWAALAKSVREIDENIVKDYKEDIDTILVFAGLYSAVLTGLLAISINNLQQDSNDVVIGLLRQLTNQTHSYSFNAGSLSSAAPPPDLQPPPFSPSLAAQRVNVLWFASLMLSLISASFGILVKQWLREFLAGTYSSPEARMRVRHFREAGLRDWKVFVFAATLPLLLQLSLASFFIGLCFFTVDIHHTVGYTTISLALAWAVLFIAVSFAPVLSPRCPYKTPILKYVTKFLRLTLFRIWDRAIPPAKRIFNRSLGGLRKKISSNALRWPYRRVDTPSEPSLPLYSQRSSSREKPSERSPASASSAHVPSATQASSVHRSVPGPLHRLWKNMVASLSCWSPGRRRLHARSPPSAHRGDAQPLSGDGPAEEDCKSRPSTSTTPSPPPAPPSPPAPSSPPAPPAPATPPPPEAPDTLQGSPPDLEQGRLDHPLTWEIPGEWTWRLLAYDEENIASVAENDMQALLALDAMQQDDRLLQKICSVLEERHTPFAEMVDFVFKVIASRLPPGQGLPPRPIRPSQMVDLTMLQPRTCVILMDTLANALAIVIKKVEIAQKIDWKVPVMQETLALFCAKLPCLPSDTVNKVLLLCASGHYRNRVIPFMDALTDRNSSGNRFLLGLHLQERLRPMFLQLGGDDLDNYLTVLSRLYCNCDSCDNVGYGQRILNHRKEMGLLLESHLMKLIVEYFQQQTKVPSAQWQAYHSNIMAFVANAWSESPDGMWRDAYIACFPPLLAHPTIGPEVSSLFFHHSYWSSAAMDACRRAFQTYVDEREVMLSSMKRSIIAYINAFDADASKQHIHPHFVRGVILFIRFQLSLLQWVVRNKGVGYQGFSKWYHPQWRAMFTKITPALRHCLIFSEIHASMDVVSQVAERCLEYMADSDEKWKHHLVAPEITASGLSLFDDEFVGVVCQLAPPDKADEYMRSRKRDGRKDPVRSMSIPTPTLGDRTRAVDEIPELGEHTRIEEIEEAVPSTSGSTSD